MVTDVMQLVEREGQRVRPLKRREFDHLVSAGVFERERVELIRDSQPDKGIYQRLTKLTGKEVLRPIAFPDVAIPVAALFTA